VEILSAIWNMAAAPHSNVLTDDEIVARLGLDPFSVFVDTDTVQERLLWMRHPRHAAIVGDDAEALLQFPPHKKLRKEDAERIMNCIHELGERGRFYDHISFENAIVQRAFHRGGLTRSLFPVGLCYYGTPPCTATMPVSQIRRILYTNAAGGGGGGGGGPTGTAL